MIKTCIVLFPMFSVYSGELHQYKLTYFRPNQVTNSLIYGNTLTLYFIFENACIFGKYLDSECSIDYDSCFYND